jgi:hypothetical protein
MWVPCSYIICCILLVTKMFVGFLLQFGNLVEFLENCPSDNHIQLKGVNELSILLDRFRLNLVRKVTI